MTPRAGRPTAFTHRKRDGAPARKLADPSSLRSAYWLSLHARLLGQRSQPASITEPAISRWRHTCPRAP
jgi:hypothetical protein